MSLPIQYQNTQLIASRQTPLSGNAVLTRDYMNVATLLNHAVINERYPSPGGVLNLGGGTAGSSLYQNGVVTMSLGTGLSASTRALLSDVQWMYNTGSGSTLNYSIPWAISFRFTTTMAITAGQTNAAQRIFVGSSVSLPVLQQIPAGSPAYSSNQRGIGVEMRADPNNIYQHQVKLFARDGTGSALLTGTYIETSFVNIGQNVENYNKMYHFVLENTGIGVAKLYAQTWLGDELYIPQNTSITPFLTLSGVGVPSTAAGVATNWGAIEAMIVNDIQTRVPSITSQRMAIGSILCYIGTLSAYYV
jgi:hypothetical protein